METYAQPPGKYETLDDLFAQATHYAEWHLREGGFMPAAIFLISADGPPTFLAYGKDFGSVASKNDFVHTAQLFCLYHAAVMSVFALEVWMTARTRENVDVTEMPSEAFDRRENIVLLGETSAGNSIKVLPIIRSGNHKFFNLGEPEQMDGYNFAGRFSNVLPTKTAPPEIRQAAGMLLTMKNVRCAGIAPRGK